MQLLYANRNNHTDFGGGDEAGHVPCVPSLISEPYLTSSRAVLVGND